MLSICNNRKVSTTYCLSLFLKTCVSLMTKIAKFLNQKTNKKKSCDISKDALSLQILKYLPDSKAYVI